jgi:hypothetical protein
MFNQLDYRCAITVGQYTGQEGLRLYNRHNYLQDFKRSVEKFTTICSVLKGILCCLAFLNHKSLLFRTYQQWGHVTQKCILLLLAFNIAHHNETHSSYYVLMFLQRDILNKCDYVIEHHDK